MAGEEGAGDSAKTFLSHKIGPLPVGIWMIAAGGIFWYMKGRKTSAGGPGAQTDPAGNVGTIDPKTGYVYGSSQDQSAQGAGFGGSGGGGGSDGSTSSGSTVAGQYADNNAWARAAINFLVGVGVDPTVANSAVTQYITSQALNTDQQGAVNLAIQSIGAPPVPPTPGTSPPPVVIPPAGGGTVYAPAPTGLAVTDKTGNTIGVRWNASTNATDYTVFWSSQGQPEVSMQVGSNATSATIPNLSPDTLYNIRVQANPAKPGGGSAQTSATTAGASAPTGGSAGGPTPPTDPHAGQHYQQPQVATLTKGRTLRQYAQGAYGAGYQPHLAILLQLNPGLGADTPSPKTQLIRTSDARWVAN